MMEFSDPFEDGSSVDQEFGEEGGEVVRGVSSTSGGGGREVEGKKGFWETVVVWGGKWEGGMQSFKIKLKVFRKPFTGRGKERCISKKLLIKC
jgi:hypothetical protein